MGDWIEWAPFEFRNGDKIHMCGTECREVPIKNSNGEFCSLTGLRLCNIISNQLYHEDEVKVTRRRIKHDDPSDIDGNLSKRARARILYEKLFTSRFIIDEHDDKLKILQRAALVEAKARGVDLAKEGLAIKLAVQKTEVFSMDELEPVTQRAMQLSALAHADFGEVLIGLMRYMASGGLLRHEQVIIPPHEKMSRLFPPNRHFAALGVNTALIGKGMNAIVSILDQIVELPVSTRHEEQSVEIRRTPKRM